jgi:hypothetical protein
MDQLHDGIGRPEHVVVTNSKSTQSDSREGRLRERQEKLRNQRDVTSRTRTAMLGLASVMILGGPLLSLILPRGDTRPVIAALVAYGLLALLVGLVSGQRSKTASEELVDVNNELDLLELVHDDRERRATKLLQVNQLDLKRYYDQALRQGNQISYVGFGCILAGFAIIGVAFWLIADHPTRPLSEQIVVGGLGAIGGVLSNFIAVIYLRMFSETIKTVGHFHGRLVGRDRINFGNLLAAKIQTDGLREETLSKMALELTVQPEISQPESQAEDP